MEAESGLRREDANAVIDEILGVVKSERRSAIVDHGRSKDDCNPSQNSIGTGLPSSRSGSPTPANGPFRVGQACRSPHPGTIEEAVLDGLTDVMGTQAAGPLQIGNGPGDFEHPIVCPGREPQAGHRLSKNPGGRIVQ